MIFASIEQENASASQAFDVLNRQPKWASVQERLSRANIRHSRLSHTLNTLESRRREALRHFTFQAVTYLDLVVDSVTADAYCNVLPLMIREAYTFFTGWPVQVMELVSQDAAEFERRIEFRYRRWVTKAYLRAQAATARNVENAAEVDPSDNPPEWATDLGTTTGRKRALEGWKRHWSTKERECTNTDLTEAAYNQKDGPFLNQWKNATTRLIDPDRSIRIQTIEAVLRQNRPPNWHPAAKKRPK